MEEVFRFCSSEKRSTPILSWVVCFGELGDINWYEKGFISGSIVTLNELVKHFAIGFNPDFREEVKVFASGFSKVRGRVRGCGNGVWSRVRTIAFWPELLTQERDLFHAL